MVPHPRRWNSSVTTVTPSNLTLHQMQNKTVFFSSACKANISITAIQHFLTKMQWTVLAVTYMESVSSGKAHPSEILVFNLITSLTTGNSTQNIGFQSQNNTEISTDY
jgi:hypothetical protein